MYTTYPYTEVTASYNASTQCVEGIMPSGISTVAIISITVDGVQLHIDTHLSQQLYDANNEDWLFGLLVEQVKQANGISGLLNEDFDTSTYGQSHLDFPKAFLPANIASTIDSSSDCSMQVAVFYSVKP